MKKTLFILTCLILLSTACSIKKSNQSTLNYDYFKNNLTPEMTHNEIVKTFGEPSRNEGSGINIYVYELNDSTEILIGYVDKIYYVKHEDKNGKLLNTIIYSSLNFH